MSENIQVSLTNAITDNTDGKLVQDLNQWVSGVCQKDSTEIYQDEQKLMEVLSYFCEVHFFIFVFQSILHYLKKQTFVNKFI